MLLKSKPIVIMSTEPHDIMTTLPALVGPSVSPDARSVAWTWVGVGPAADVYVAPTDGQSPPVALAGSAADTALVSWTPDGGSLLVKQSHAGDRTRLFLVDPSHPGSLKLVADVAAEAHLHGGQIDRSGQFLIYAAQLDPATGAPSSQCHLFRHGLRSGERQVLAGPYRVSDGRPELNPQGTHVLYTRSDPHRAGRQLWLVDVDGEVDREILNFGPSVKLSACWCPDGRRILLRVEAGSVRHVGLWDMWGGRLRWLLDDPRRTVEDAFVPNGSGHAVLVEVREARLRASLLDLDSGAERLLPELDGCLVPLAPVPGLAWVGQWRVGRNPAELVRFDLEDVRPESFVTLSRLPEKPFLRAEPSAVEEMRRRAHQMLRLGTQAPVLRLGLPRWCLGV